MVKNFAILVLCLSFVLPFRIMAKEQKTQILTENMGKKVTDVLVTPEEYTEKNNYSRQGTNGSLTYLFGATIPTLFCTPLKLSEIRLEAGETLNDPPKLGDSRRWEISPIRSGKKENQILSILIKPLESGLETNLVLATNRRSYTIILKSDIKNHTPCLDFDYLDNLEKKWILEVEKESISRQAEFPETTEKIEELDFKYSFSGYKMWFPSRVYNNGKQTVICMPSIIELQEMPALLVTNHDKTKRVVNYRIKENRYIVDQVFNEAVLISGVGVDQKKVTIKKRWRNANASNGNSSFVSATSNYSR